MACHLSKRSLLNEKPLRNMPRRFTMNSSSSTAQTRFLTWWDVKHRPHCFLNNANGRTYRWLCGLSPELSSVWRIVFCWWIHWLANASPWREGSLSVQRPSLSQSSVCSISGPLSVFGNWRVTQPMFLLLIALHSVFMRDDIIGARILSVQLPYVPGAQQWQFLLAAT